MKKVNFLVEGNYALDVNGSHIDLHNDFDFEGIEFSIKKNRIIISWKKSIGDWVQNDVPEHVRIVFNKLSFLKLQVDDYNQSHDKETLSFIGYLHPDDVDLMDGCLNENEATSAYHMIIAFESGFVIKVFSEEVMCILNRTSGGI